MSKSPTLSEEFPEITKEVDHTIYENLPPKFEYDENKDELFQALKFLREKIKNLNESPRPDGDVSSYSVDEAVQTQEAPLVPPVPVSNLPKMEDLQTELSDELKIVKEDYNQSLRNTRNLQPTLNNSNSPMLTPRSITLETAERIKNRISTILRPPLDLGQGDNLDHKILQDKEDLRLFLDEVESNLNPPNLSKSLHDSFDQPHNLELPATLKMKQSLSDMFSNLDTGGSIDEHEMSLVLANALAESGADSVNLFNIKKEIQVELGQRELTDSEASLPKLEIEQEVVDPKRENMENLNPPPNSKLHQPDLTIPTQEISPESQNIYLNITDHIQAANQRCIDLEKQLSEMKSIIKATSDKNSAEIERIIEESRQECNLETRSSVSGLAKGEGFNTQYVSKFSLDSKGNLVETKILKPSSSNPKLDINDPQFLADVVKRLKAKNLNRKQAKKAAEKLALHTIKNELCLEKLKNLRLESESAKNSPRDDSMTLRGDDLVQVRKYQNFDRPKTAHQASRNEYQPRNVRGYTRSSNKTSNHASSNPRKNRPSSVKPNSRRTPHTSGQNVTDTDIGKQTNLPHFAQDTYQSRQRKIENHKITKELNCINQDRILKGENRQSSEKILNPRLVTGKSYLHKKVASRESSSERKKKTLHKKIQKQQSKKSNLLQESERLVPFVSGFSGGKSYLVGGGNSVKTAVCTDQVSRLDRHSTIFCSRRTPTSTYKNSNLKSKLK